MGGGGGNAVSAFSFSKIQAFGNLAITLMAPGVLPTYKRSLIDFSSHYLGDGLRPAIFGGRGRELAALDAWLEDPLGPRHLLVTGPAGRGKSALLVHWLESVSRSRAVSFVPVSIRFGTNSVEAFYTILAGKLSAICGLILPSVSTDIAGTFREICFDLLEQIHKGSKPLIIAFDGLDEGTGWKVDRRLLRASSNVRILVCQSACKRDPRSAPNRDPLGGRRSVDAGGEFCSAGGVGRA